jgi:hypothetical protein
MCLFAQYALLLYFSHKGLLNGKKNLLPGFEEALEGAESQMILLFATEML